MTQIEINKHKTNIINLAMKLSNTFIINEEISINNEIKKETEFLESLLNIKKHQNMPQSMNQIIQQPMMQQQMQQQMFQQLFQQQMMQQQMMMQKQMMNIPLDDEKDWNLIFEDSRTKEIVNIRISEQRLVKEAISLYRLKSGKNDDNLKFIFHNRELYPEMKICQTGLSNFSKIIVIESENIMGG